MISVAATSSSSLESSVLRLVRLCEEIRTERNAEEPYTSPVPSLDSSSFELVRQQSWKQVAFAVYEVVSRVQVIAQEHLLGTLLHRRELWNEWGWGFRRAEIIC